MALALSRFDQSTLILSLTVLLNSCAIALNSLSPNASLAVSCEAKSANETTDENNTTFNEKVNRNNVFDYLLVWNKTMIVYGKRQILANNKSGSVNSFEETIFIISLNLVKSLHENVFSCFTF